MQSIGFPSDSTPPSPDASATANLGSDYSEDSPSIRSPTFAIPEVVVRAAERRVRSRLDPTISIDNDTTQLSSPFPPLIPHRASHSRRSSSDRGDSSATLVKSVVGLGLFLDNDCKASFPSFPSLGSFPLTDALGDLEGTLNNMRLSEPTDMRSDDVNSSCDSEATLADDDADTSSNSIDVKLRGLGVDLHGSNSLFNRILVDNCVMDIDAFLTDIKDSPSAPSEAPRTPSCKPSRLLAPNAPILNIPSTPLAGSASHAHTGTPLAPGRQRDLSLLAGPNAYALAARASARGQLDHASLVPPPTPRLPSGAFPLVLAASWSADALATPALKKRHRREVSDLAAMAGAPRPALQLIQPNVRVLKPRSEKSQGRKVRGSGKVGDLWNRVVVGKERRGKENKENAERPAKKVRIGDAVFI